jgi:hypothetical protein
VAIRLGILRRRGRLRLGIRRGRPRGCARSPAELARKHQRGRGVLRSLEEAPDRGTLLLPSDELSRHGPESVDRAQRGLRAVHDGSNPLSATQTLPHERRRLRGGAHDVRSGRRRRAQVDTSAPRRMEQSAGTFGGDHLACGMDEHEASDPPAAVRLHWSGIAVVYAGPDAALADRPLRSRAGRSRRRSLVRAKEKRSGAPPAKTLGCWLRMCRR